MQSGHLRAYWIGSPWSPPQGSSSGLQVASEEGPGHVPDQGPTRCWESRTEAASFPTPIWRPALQDDWNRICPCWRVTPLASGVLPGCLVPGEAGPLDHDYPAQALTRPQPEATSWKPQHSRRPHQGPALDSPPSTLGWCSAQAGLLQMPFPGCGDSRCQPIPEPLATN